MNAGLVLHCNIPSVITTPESLYHANFGFGNLHAYENQVPQIDTLKYGREWLHTMSWYLSSIPVLDIVFPVPILSLCGWVALTFNPKVISSNPSQGEKFLPKVFSSWRGLDNTEHFLIVSSWSPPPSLLSSILLRILLFTLFFLYLLLFLLLLPNTFSSSYSYFFFFSSFFIS